MTWQAVQGLLAEFDPQIFARSLAKRLTSEDREELFPYLSAETLDELLTADNLRHDDRLRLEREREARTPSSFLDQEGTSGCAEAFLLCVPRSRGSERLEPAVGVPMHLEPSSRDEVQVGLLQDTGFEQAFIDAIQAAREVTGSRSPLALRVPSAKLPLARGGSHGMAVFLAASLFLRYRVGPPPWLWATGVLKNNRVLPVAPDTVRAKLDRALRAFREAHLCLPSANLYQVPAELHGRVIPIPEDEPLADVLARVEREILSRSPAWLRFGTREVRSRLAWVELLIDQRRAAPDRVQAELDALDAVLAQDHERFPNERVLLQELRARTCLNEGDHQRSIRAVRELRDRIAQAKALHGSLDLRFQWIAADLDNRYANVWLESFDFETGRRMAKQALETAKLLRDQGLASKSDVARVRGTLGRAWLYSKGVSDDPERALRKARKAFDKALKGIDPADRPRNENYLGHWWIARAEDQGVEALDKAWKRFHDHLATDIQDSLSTNLAFTLMGLARTVDAFARVGTAARVRKLLGEVAAQLESAIAAGRVSDAHYPTPVTCRYLARARLFLDVEPMAARSELLSAAERFERHASPNHVLPVLAALFRLDLVHDTLRSGRGRDDLATHRARALELCATFRPLGPEPKLLADLCAVAKSDDPCELLAAIERFPTFM